MYDEESRMQEFLIKMHTLLYVVVVVVIIKIIIAREATAAAEGNWHGKSKFVYLSLTINFHDDEGRSSNFHDYTK